MIVNIAGSFTAATASVQGALSWVEMRCAWVERGVYITIMGL